MGNICRSPMAEKRLDLAGVVAADGPGEELIHSHSAGTGGWHAGEEMHPSAARQILARGGAPDGFRARKLRSEHIDAADLVLVATGDQQLYVTALRPDAAGRTFVLGHLGRLLPLVDLAALPKGDLTPEMVHTRGVALVRSGGAPDGFRARKLRSEHIDAADLVLVATGDQQLYVTALRPDAAGRTFVLGHLGRLLPLVDLAALPKGDLTPEMVHTRGVALV